MTDAETKEALRRIVAWWPASRLTRPDLAGYVERIGGYPWPAVERALERISNRGEQFAPSPGAICLEVERIAQGNPPSWTEATALIARKVAAHSGPSTERSAETFVAYLSEHGHEAVARFVAAQGLQAVRTMPDPSRTDRDAGFALGAMGREYAETVKGWEADPTPGLALAEVAPRRAVGGRGPRALDARKALGVGSTVVPDAGGPDA